MSSALPELLGSLSPGDDPIAVIQAMLDEEVFPKLSGAFWAQVWLSFALLAIIILSFVSALTVRFTRRRLQIFIPDGALTRLDVSIGVPILWTVEATLNIICGILFRHNMLHKSHSVILGRFLYLLHLPLIISYALVTSDIVASAPAVRKHFINMRRGALWFNVIWSSIAVAMCVGVVPPAFALGNSLHHLSLGYAAAIAILDDARSSGDLTLLFGLQEPMIFLDTAAEHNANATRSGALLYAGYIVFFLVACIVPGALLTRHVRRKVDRLETNDGESKTSGQSSSLQSSFACPIREFVRLDQLPSKNTLSAIKAPSDLPEQPQDRPFAGLIVLDTPLLPARFDDILRDESHTSAERAIRLRQTLKSDLRFLAAYALLLCAYGGMSIFLAAKSWVILSTRQDLAICLAFPTWNFVVPALIVSTAFLYDAIVARGKEETKRAPLLGQVNNSSSVTAGVSNIQCRQIIDVTYSTDRTEKRFEDLMDEEVQIARQDRLGVTQ